MKIDIRLFAIGLIVILGCLVVPAGASSPPSPECYDDGDCDGCEKCSGGNCVDDDSKCNGCESCTGGSCVDDDDNCTGECEVCNDANCVDDDSLCTGECHDGCSGGECVDDNSKCSSWDCEDCNDGVCEDRCPALGKHCHMGSCVECRDIADCDLCEKCPGFECVHPCDDCDDWPQYCIYNCFCISCDLGNGDGGMCSESQDSNCPKCTIQTTNPCSNHSMKDYTGAIIYSSCTGLDCNSIEQLCYTEYDCTTGDVEPLEICSSGDMVGPKSCLINIDYPSWCWPCKKDPTDEGEPSDEDSYEECPAEE